MEHIVGIKSSTEKDTFSPLDSDSKIRFSTSHLQTVGYFELISPCFEEFAMRDSHKSLQSIHVHFTLSNNDFDRALVKIGELKETLSTYPDVWKANLPSYSYRYCKPRSKYNEQKIIKSRAFSIIDALKILINLAKENNKVLMYGKGACYLSLANEKLPPGVKYYS